MVNRDYISKLGWVYKKEYYTFNDNELIRLFDYGDYISILNLKASSDIIHYYFNGICNSEDDLLTIMRLLNIANYEH